MIQLGRRKRVTEVFGISPEILPDSYVDRGQLDSEIARQLSRNNHIALRGESKCGKSWLRKRNIPDAIVVQCRLGKTVNDIYKDILSELGISIKLEENISTSLKSAFEINGGLAVKIIAKVGTKLGFEVQEQSTGKYKIIGKDIDDIRFICEVINASDRRVVVEDFHYMTVSERKSFAFDLKTMWDYSTFIIIVGVWSQSNMLIFLNPDLAGRIEEISIYWTDSDLLKVIDKGSQSLRVDFSDDLKKKLVSDSFGNCGILQKLTLGVLDEAGIHETCAQIFHLDNISLSEGSGMKYAEQLNPVYQQFAGRVSKGIRKRSDATGIYAHAMAVIMAADDEILKNGFSLDDIHKIAYDRQPRIQKGNLRTVLEKFEILQVDEEGRGLVLAFNEANDEIHVVDRQILLYRRYATVKWPWENMISEVDQREEGFDADRTE